ncbi:DUF5054 domain-containing protein [Paenibacillus sp. LHD-117]|uniref:DUF5054 domain-containing protein n=1 Tax=Paenibacillus sp. LHD-117 TaxID=3071412 RepID=UPI0027E1BBEB|nr:DUF5054 domain-containing protein [Paenibacillus sp. LHD-117]MDQ6417954.1 DUF5054 domain-containing protein [Paenibacillus sp. LHD-117]
MIARVHVIFKTHLDIGFTDMGKTVVDRYMNGFIPQALDLSEQLAREEGNVKFVWTTGSWLINEYMATASPAMRTRMEEAIRQGRIVWHGLPFTTHTEIMDASLFEFGISLSRNLDRQFGKTTIAAKMTDVPGHTIAMVPLLARHGIQYLHLGVNMVSRNPDVPKLFVWRAADGSEVIVNYADSYGKPFQMEGLADALYFAHTGDNHGPSTMEEIRALFAQLQEQYPGAEIIASTLDAFAEKLLAVKHLLPVVTEEIGDSWIHGIASDPWKVARYRELLRLRDQWTDSGRLDPLSEPYAQFCNRLMLIPEHTWGLNNTVYLVDFSNYSASDFAAARERDVVDDEKLRKYDYLRQLANESRSYRYYESSWQEQRDYLDEAIGALPSELAYEAEQALERLNPRNDFDGGESRNSSQDTKPIAMNELYEMGQFQVSFAADGSINRLIDRSGKEWAGDGQRIGTFRYETFSKESYDRFFKEYVTNLDIHHSWADNDLGKPGIEYVKPRPEHRCREASLKSLILKREAGYDIAIAELKLPEEACVTYGAPRRLTLVYKFHADEPVVDVELLWNGKQACRLPEASWLSVAPLVNNPNAWTMDKLGERISPLSVVKDGNRNMHGIGKGLYYDGADGSAVIESLDAPLVCPGEPRLLQFDNTYAPLDGGFHFNLHNNVWGTNFVMWFEDDMKFRFRILLRSNR